MQKNLPTRKKIRLNDYDYSKENMYFITICVKDRLEIFGKILENNIKLTKKGIIVKQNIYGIEEIYKNVLVDEYIIMPNHVHMLLSIQYKSNATISKIIKHFKANISREMGCSIWQKSFYEHIIRNEKEYIEIKEYIRNNIAKWENDKYFNRAIKIAPTLTLQILILF